MTPAEKVIEAKRLLSEVAESCATRAASLRSRGDAVSQDERWTMIDLEYVEGHLHKSLLHRAESILDYYHDKLVAAEAFAPSAQPAEAPQETKP